MTAPAASVQQDREIASRAERGWDLHLTKRQLIIQTDETTYSVPGSSAGSEARSYTVHYGDGDLEECTCTDFRVSDLSCKHIVAVALIYARRRRARSRCEQCGVSSGEKALLGSTIGSSLSRPPLTPPPRPAAGFPIRNGPVLDATRVPPSRLYSAECVERVILRNSDTL